MICKDNISEMTIVRVFRESFEARYFFWNLINLVAIICDEKLKCLRSKESDEKYNSVPVTHQRVKLFNDQ